MDLLFDIIMGFLSTVSDTLMEPTAEHSGIKPVIHIVVIVLMLCLLAGAIIYGLLH